MKLERAIQEKNMIKFLRIWIGVLISKISVLFICWMI